MAFSTVLPDGVQLGLTLDRYQEIMRLPEAAFNGLDKPDDEGHYFSTVKWQQIDRDALATGIAEAEDLRERELGYYVVPRYTAAEDYPFKKKINLDHRLLVKVAMQAENVLATDVAFSLRDLYSTLLDPVTISFNASPLPTGISGTEIMVYYPGTKVPIKPKSVLINTTTGQITITVPRSRLKAMTVDGNDPNWPLYTDDNVLITSVDVTRLWYDVSQGAYLVWNGTDCQYVPETMAEVLQLAYPVIDNYRLGSIVLYPALYDLATGVWTKTQLTKPSWPQLARINYLSGRKGSMATEMETAKLAHCLESTFLPSHMSLLQNMWKEDRASSDPKMMTPYGYLQGAVFVWIQDSRAKIGNGGKF